MTALGHPEFHLSCLKSLQPKKLLSAGALVENLEGHKFRSLIYRKVSVCLGNKFTRAQIPCGPVLLWKVVKELVLNLYSL